MRTRLGNSTVGRVVWGLVIGWLITPPQNYDQAIIAANLSRVVAAAQDLDTFRAIP